MQNFKTLANLLPGEKSRDQRNSHINSSHFVCTAVGQRIHSAQTNLFGGNSLSRSHLFTQFSLCIFLRWGQGLYEIYSVLSDL